MVNRVNSNVYKLLPNQKDLNHYRWLLQQRDKLLKGGADNDITPMLRELLLHRYPDGNAPVAVDEPLPFTLKEVSSAVAAVSVRVHRDGIDTQQAWQQLCNERSRSGGVVNVRRPAPSRSRSPSPAPLVEDGHNDGEEQHLPGDEEHKQMHSPSISSSSSSLLDNIPPLPVSRPISQPLIPRPTQRLAGHRRHPARPPSRPPSSVSVPSLFSNQSSSQLYDQSDRRALVRDFIGEVLPALLQQQKALMGSAFDAMSSSSDAKEDNDMQYGCRNCETLQRQLEELRAVNESLTAEMGVLNARMASEQTSVLLTSAQPSDSPSLSSDSFAVPTSESVIEQSQSQPQSPPSIDSSNDAVPPHSVQIDVDAGTSQSSDTSASVHSSSKDVADQPDRSLSLSVITGNVAGATAIAPRAKRKRKNEAERLWEEL